MTPFMYSRSGRVRVKVRLQRVGLFRSGVCPIPANFGVMLDGAPGSRKLNSAHGVRESLQLLQGESGGPHEGSKDL